MRRLQDILFLCQFFHPEYISSAQLPFDTVKALQKAGFSVGVLCGYPKEYYNGAPVPKCEVLDGVNVRRLKYIQLGRKGFLGRIINYFSFTAAVLLHLGVLKQSKAVAVYSNPPILPWIAAWANRLFGTKLVFICYDAYPEVALRMGALREGSAICRLMERINRAVFGNAAQVVALGSEMKDFLVENRKISRECITVIPNWAEDSFQAQPDFFEHFLTKLTEHKFVVSYLGNMGTAQDMETVYEAVKALRDRSDIFFLFAGHGNKKADLEARIQDDGLTNIRLLDFLQGDDYRAALAVSDGALVSLEQGLSGICVPSKTYGYMMAGLPLLCVLEQGDIVRDCMQGAGICVGKGEGKKLAEAIADLADHPEKVKKMGQKSRELYLQHYTKPICTEQYVQLFREILK